MQSPTLDLTPDVTAFADKAEWTGVRDDDRPAWHAFRRTLLTASDMAAVLGEDDNRAALDVYVDKVVEQPDEVLALDDARFWGKVLEQPILQTVARYHGWGYRKGGALLRSRKHPFLGATLDAEVDCRDGLGWLALEGKTTTIGTDWDEESGALPVRVVIQVQHQLLVTGAARAIVFALIRGSRGNWTPVTISIEPHVEFHRVLVEHGQAFLELVKNGTPPPPNGTAASGRALRRLFPSGNGSAVALPQEALEWTREYQAAAEQIKQFEGRKAYFAQMLKNSIGPATFGVLPESVGNKRCWRWLRGDGKKASSFIALKLPPYRSRRHDQLPPANDILRTALEASVVADEEDGSMVTPIRFGSKRRRSKR